MSDSLSLARDFIAEDPDPGTRAELEALAKRVEGGDEAARKDLDDRFSGPLEFGTAGLRGKVEAGLARMNRLVVIKASWGFASHVLETAGKDARARGVAIGFDGRHPSRRFAEDAAAVLGGLGVKALLFTDPVPTPLLAFAVKRLGAVGGVMVTASHNPPHDNGYKVYLPTGGQIIPPTDTAIAARLEAAPRIDRVQRLAPAVAAAQGLRVLVDATDRAVEQAYLDGLAESTLHRGESGPLRIAYTPMHGVGHRLMIRAFARAGFEGVASEPTQADP